MVKLPASINTTPETRFYTELGKQDLSFEQTLAELIDNSISADSKNIEVHIIEDGEKIKLVVADDGSGITISDLINRVLRMGAPPSTPGVMNEHGFGLKNSLSRLTEGHRQFTLLTKARSDSNFYAVRGPLRGDMKVNRPDRSEKLLWTSNISELSSNSGTRIYAETTLTFLNTTLHKLYERGRRPTRLEEKQIDVIKEHLGVFYRRWLDNDHKLFLKWKTTGGKLKKARISAMTIPYKHSPTPSRLVIQEGSNSYEVYYSVGELDKDLSARLGFKIYYQGNQRTQGIDVIFRKRIILPHLLSELFPLTRHNSLNWLVGELVIEDPIFTTFNNKTGLDPNNSIVSKLLEELNDRYVPQSSSGAYNLGEASLRRKIAQALETGNPGSTAQENAPIWSLIGVKVDILHQMSNAEEIIYEIKNEELAPLNIYQLIMYWDGRVADKKRPKLARIVSTENESAMIKKLVKYFNKRKDAGGKPYKIEFVHADKLLGV